MVKTLVLVATFAGCTSSATPPDATAGIPDSPIGTIDSSASPDGAVAACTGALYDPCTGNSGCMSQNCHPFGTAGFSACTQACSPSNPCPTQNGNAIPCNNMGLCRPSATNACTP